MAKQGMKRPHKKGDKELKNRKNNQAKQIPATGGNTKNSKEKLTPNTTPNEFV